MRRVLVPLMDIAAVELLIEVKVAIWTAPLMTQALFEVPLKSASSPTPGTTPPDQFAVFVQLLLAPFPIQVRVAAKRGEDARRAKTERAVVQAKDARRQRPAFSAEFARIILCNEIVTAVTLRIH